MRTRLLALVLCVPGLLAAKVDDLESFQRAQTLYADLEFEQAIFALEEVALAEGLEPADRARVFAWLGLCHFQVRRPDEGRRYLQMAVGADPATGASTRARKA